MRGCWLVGPMKSPENKYESDGWFCQKPIRLREQIGTAQKSAVGGSAAADNDVITAAGAGMASVEHELFRTRDVSDAPEDTGRR